MKKITYKFSDRKGVIYIGEFTDRDAAMEFAYVCGLHFIGKA